MASASAWLLFVNFLEGERAFSVRERIAFWDFLVPNARPRALRAAFLLWLLAAAETGVWVAVERGVERTVRVFEGMSWRVEDEGSKIAR